MEEFHSWVTITKPASVPPALIPPTPFLPFVISDNNNCSWIVRAPRGSIKWVMIEKIRTTRTTDNCQCKILTQDQIAKGRTMVSSYLENKGDGTCILCPITPQAWWLVIYCIMSVQNQPHMLVSLLIAFIIYCIVECSESTSFFSFI